MSSNSEASGLYARSIANVELVHARGIDAFFEAEWEALGQNAEHANPYFEPWFLKHALASFDHQGEVYFLIVRNRVTRQMVGLLPVVRMQDYRKFPIAYFQTWMHPFCFNGVPLIARDWTVSFFEAAAGWIDGNPKNARFLQLLAHPFSPQLRSAIIEGFSPSRVFIQDIYERPFFTKASANGDALDDRFKTSISAKHRSNLRRTWRRLNEKGTVTLGNIAISPALIEDHLALEKRGWKNPKNNGLTSKQVSANDHFMRTLLINGAQEGKASCRGIKIDGQTIAMAFQFTSNDQAVGFKTVYDEDFATYSPGVHVLLDVVENVFQNPDLQSFDSCSQAGHSLLTRVMPDRLPIAQLNLTQSGKLDRALMSTLSIVN